MNVLDQLRGGLIVSVQARAGSAIDDPHVLVAMAMAAQKNGAVAVRMQGVTNIRIARRTIDVPMIGLIKREYEGYEPYITPTLAEVREVIGAGAEIVAFDATDRARPGGTTLGDIIRAIRATGRLAMADCSTVQDAERAIAAGAEIVATTLCGYTKETAESPLPALDLVRELAARSGFVICEGGVARPEQLAEALRAGADAVVVGTAITNVDVLVGEFAAAASKRRV